MKINYFLSKTARGNKTFLAAITSLTLLGAMPPAQAASPSDTLEQGVYSEDTKGDLDAAMALYQQVIADAKSNATVAAQAQYRLGTCYYKKGDYAKANAAFQTVVTDYPDQKDLVALAQDYLNGANPLEPAPWADGEQDLLDIKLAGGLKVGVACYSVSSGETNGQKIWRISSRLSGGAQSISRVEVDAETMKPIHSHWKHSLIGEADATYSSDHVDLTIKGKDATTKMDITGSVIDNEEAVQWMRRLPLAVGYTNTMTVFSTLGGSCVPIQIEVPSIEKVIVPAGTYDAYRVELKIGQTFWYSTNRHHYLIKFEAGGVLAELTQVRQLTANEPATYQDPTYNCSLSAPSGWLFDRSQAPGDDQKGATINLLDPDANADSQVEVKALTQLRPDEKASLKAYAQEKVADAAKMHQNFQVRSNSWKEFSLSGSLAISAIADYTESKKQKVGYGVWVFAKTNGLYFEFLAPADNFDSLRPQFDSIVNSLQTP